MTLRANPHQFFSPIVYHSFFKFGFTYNFFLKKLNSWNMLLNYSPF